MARNRQAKRPKPQHPKGLPNGAMSPKVAAHPRNPKPAGISELDLIRGVRFQQWAAEEELHEAVADARRQRFTWREIGEALGVTAQSAHKRFGPSRVDQ